MTTSPPATPMDGVRILTSPAGLRIELLSHGAVGRIDGAGVTINLFPGHEVEGGPANLWLRRHGRGGQFNAVPLLGPQSPLTLGDSTADHVARGRWLGLEITLQLRLAADVAAWFWHVAVDNGDAADATLDLIAVQDIGLAPYGAIRLNEHYVSHYIDLAPLTHQVHGSVLAARQNQAAAGRNPWALMGSLRRAVGHATDALQVQGLAMRAGARPLCVVAGLPSRRLQHEHALLALQDERVTLRPGEQARLGIFLRVLDDHPSATSDDDLALVDQTLALPEAAAPVLPATIGALARAAPSLFASAPWLTSQALDIGELDMLFGPMRRHVEHEGGQLLSFFHSDQSHVVLRAKELRVQRPHGHILRTGRHLTPDETSLTSTVWMGGIFHSMLTQGHVSINRALSTARGYLGQYRAPGQRIFVELAGRWQQLGMPSAFEIEPDACRWLYKDDEGLFEVRSEALHEPQAMVLRVRVLAGPARRLLVTHHLALGGDDGRAPPLPPIRSDGEGLFVGVPVGSELAERFPAGGFAIVPEAGSRFARSGGDELLYPDDRSRGQPFVCIVTDSVATFGLRLEGRLVDTAVAARGDAPLPEWQLPAASPLAEAAQQLADVLPWYRHNAMVHYLSPRGLEQYSGGGWGTRDVCQGPLEMLLALDRGAAVRDLLCRVFAAQNADGDWPQWFMFFDRERQIRAADSHGDIVFWPLVALAQYLLSTGDATLLDQALPFHAAEGAPAEIGSVWAHVERAFGVIRARRIPGTQLAAYGHGDWNDSLQPADPALRERLCSAWTVTLHHQMLGGLARALRRVGRHGAVAELQAEADAVLADFQRLLVPDGVVTGYALFPPGAPPQMLLHPSDTRTGVHYSLLPMMHAILDNMLTPAQARAHLVLIERELSGPDGARLFDRPLPYRGGPQTLFQRAESSAFFGREIGVMYMHAHLRYAQALAHLGDAGRFFDALRRAHPIALRACVPSASLRQANCYYSSSDAAFADRYEAHTHYGRIAGGEVALDGGWRIYSSGPGIAIALVVGSFLGLRREHDTLVVDPVIPPALDGLRVRTEVRGHRLEVEYRLGPAGCGPLMLELDGTPLPFTLRVNPYRAGAAAVALNTLTARLAAGGRTLVVHTG